MKALEKKNEERNQVELILMEEFVHKDHLLRKIENAVNFIRVYKMVEAFLEQIFP